MTKTKPYTIDALRSLVAQNKSAHGSDTCSSLECRGISCKGCPMVGQSTNNLNGAFVTIGEARTSLRKQERILLMKVDEGASPTTVEDPSVKQPSHYQVFDGLESISVIARSMTVEQFKGFCMGNTLKYRLRAGKKSDQANVTKDLAKAEFYKELFEKHKGECYVAK